MSSRNAAVSKSIVNGATWNTLGVVQTLISGL